MQFDCVIIAAVNVEMLSVLWCIRGLRLLLVSKQTTRGPSADAQHLMLLLDSGNFQRAEVEVNYFATTNSFLLQLVF